jgi:hypothetical protein
LWVFMPVSQFFNLEYLFWNVNYITVLIFATKNLAFLLNESRLFYF